MPARHALIPARGGSKRVPRKNVRPFLGVPTIARVIGVLRDADCFDSIVVSTDDEEISDVARASGALVPFRRNPALAEDTTGARVVIQDAVDALALKDDDLLSVVYATAVLLDASDVNESLTLLTSDVDFVLAVTEFPAPIERALSLNESGLVSERAGGHTLSRSQDLARAYYDVGQLYWGTAQAWRSHTPVVQARTRAYVMPNWRVVDIDTPADWERAERVFQGIHGG